MSSTHRVRRSEMIGCNIKPGSLPGGFTQKFGLAQCEYTKRARARGSISANEVKEAAKAVLEKRGSIHAPSDFRDSTAPFSSYEKPIVGPLIGLAFTPH